MAVNFCSPAFGTTVTCSSVSADGYEPQNLLRPGRFRQWKGFLAEHFIKPPVNITFTFPFKIDICSIIIDPTVGSQRSSGIEIFSAYVPEEKRTEDGGKAGSHVLARSESGKSDALIVSTNIGKGYCHNECPRLIQFLNRRYRPVYKDLSMPPTYPEGTVDVLTREFRSPSASCVRNVNQVVIKLSRVQGGSVPALKKVEIWGQPAPSNGKSVVQGILETVRHLQGLGSKQINALSTSTTASNGRSKNKLCVEPSGKLHASQKSTASSTHLPVQCPEEFLDAITCEIMVIPILLPSGHTIDQSTLEKHNRIEATWGRPPNNPFTGVAFSSTIKPIPNVKLKGRLDKFLLMGGDSFRNVPRTAGRTSEGDLHPPSMPNVMSSVLVQPNQVGSSHRFLSLSDENVKSKTSEEQHSRTKRKHIKVEGSSQGYIEQYSRKLPKRPRLADVPSTTTDFISQDTNVERDAVSHEKAVSDSLDNALTSTLASLPSYSRLDAAKTSVSSASQPTACVNCGTQLQASENLMYNMPCQHLICRKCTSHTKDHEILCNQCNRSFRTSDLLRVHRR